MQEDFTTKTFPEINFNRLENEAVKRARQFPSIKQITLFPHRSGGMCDKDKKYLLDTPSATIYSVGDRSKNQLIFFIIARAGYRVFPFGVSLIRTRVGCFFICMDYCTLYAKKTASFFGWFHEPL